MRILKELIFASLIVAGVIAAGGQAGAQEKTIKIATEGAYIRPSTARTPAVPWSASTSTSPRRSATR